LPRRPRTEQITQPDVQKDGGPDSDVNVPVDFEPGRAPSLLWLSDAEEELSGVFDDRTVGLCTPEDLSRCFHDNVVA
jgi:uncharacterized protein